MQPDKALRADVLDIIFEDRNKEYGAYVLRKSYAKVMNKAFLITLLLLAFSFSLPFLVKLLTPKEEIASTKKKVSKVVELAEPLRWKTNLSLKCLKHLRWKKPYSLYLLKSPKRK